MILPIYYHSHVISRVSCICFYHVVLYAPVNIYLIVGAIQILFIFIIIIVFYCITLLVILLCSKPPSCCMYIEEYIWLSDPNCHGIICQLSKTCNSQSGHPKVTPLPALTVQPSMRHSMPQLSSHWCSLMKRCTST
jgi:hypothetical protein